MKTFALSLRPDIAFLTSIGDITIILHQEKLDISKLIFHACSYVGEEDKEEGLSNLQLDGATSEMSPENSFIGWAKVKNIKEYNAQSFQLDAEKHGYGNNFNKFLAENSAIGATIFGYELEGFKYLKLPIMGIGSTYVHGNFWEAETPFEGLCFNRAIKHSEFIDMDAVNSKFDSQNLS